MNSDNFRSLNDNKGIKNKSQKEKNCAKCTSEIITTFIRTIIKLSCMNNVKPILLGNTFVLN